VIDNAKSRGSQRQIVDHHRETRRTKSDYGIWLQIDRSIGQILSSLPWNAGKTKRYFSAAATTADITVAKSMSLHNQVMRRSISLDQLIAGTLDGFRIDVCWGQLRWGRAKKPEEVMILPVTVVLRAPTGMMVNLRPTHASMPASRYANLPKTLKM